MNQKMKLTIACSTALASLAAVLPTATAVAATAHTATVHKTTSHGAASANSAKAAKVSADTKANTSGNSAKANAAMNKLVAQAKKEGTIHGFGMPANWANLGGMWSSFSKTYGVNTLYQAEGNMSSGEELQAFQKEKNHPIGDVGDIGISFGPIAIKMGVVAPHKNPYWNQIPKDLKDPHGYWAAAYYGVLSFEVNTDKVKDIPHTWKDLLKPEYKGMIGFGDPRQAAEQFDSVIAAAYAFGGNQNNVQPGINFFKKLRQSGNWAGANQGPSQMKTGQVAIEIQWNYLALADQQQFKGSPHIAIVIPKDATVAGPYVEVINKYAPHPAAARLLNDYLFSNAGQISYAKGGAYPVRYGHVKLPKSVHLPKLNMKSVHFLVGNFNKATKTITNEWGSQVLGQ